MSVDPWLDRPWRGVVDLAAVGRAWEPGPQVPEAVDLMTVALAERGAGPAARANVARLADGAVAVVTGQQPALGGGPLYSLIKSLHAVALAQALEDAGVPAVAVFWCAAEDHDVGEAGHADLITRDGDLQRVHAGLTPGLALHRQDATAAWPDLIRALEGIDLPPLGREWVQAAAPEAGEGYGRWLCRLWDRLFASAGLVAVEAQTLRPALLPGLQRALAAWPAAALAERAEQLSAAGLDAPLGELAQPPVFADREDGRRALVTDEAAALLATAPEQASPGAALRPVLQQLALPAVAYVAGPGEIAYHRQLTALYPALGTAPPVLVPRASLTLVPPHVRRGLAKWDLDPGALPTTGPLPLCGEADRGAIEDRLAGLDAALAALRSGADDDARLRTGLHRLQRERERLAASLARGAREAACLPALGSLRAWLAPRDGRQERSLSLLQALWCWGPGIVERLTGEDLVGLAGGHRFVEL